ncbi:MAG: glycosyltransferase family 39 protein, partial [Armatimonadota bacterium]|nr:glycosyltransferase family 39 protein [Armatimonadota bacterium]
MARRDIFLLAALIAVYLLFAGAYCAITPAATAEQHNPDENAHIEYVATLASGHLPVFTDVMHGYENHQPPLYYALAVPVYLAAHSHGEAAAARAVRGVSILLGALLILAAYGCIRTAFPQERWTALGTAIFVGLLPGNVALSASVTNDALTNLVTAVALWLLAKIVTDADSRRRERYALWLGITLGIGVWTKTSTLILFPTVLLACYLLAARQLASPASAVRIAGVACGGGALIGLPWLLRNQILYGDPVAQHIFTSAFSNTA